MAEQQRRTGRSRRHRGAAGSRPSGNNGRIVPLHKRVASHFEPGDRQRGQELFQANGIELETEGTRVRAQVPGTERPFYNVGLEWSQVPDKRILHAFCECQRFAEGKPCKHVWATLLALAEGDATSQPPGKDRLKLRKDRGIAWREMGVAEGDGAVARKAESERPRTGRYPDRQRRGRGRSGGASSIEPATSWRVHLEAVREELERQAAHEPAAEGAPGQLRFVINTTASQSAGALILDLFEPRPGDGGKLQRANVEPSDLQRELLAGRNGAGEAAAALVVALAAEGVNRQGRGRRGHVPAKLPSRIQRLRLPRDLHDTVLPRLAGQGALGWWDGRNLGEVTLVSWDGAEPWRLALRLEVTALGSGRLGGFLERERETVPLVAAEWILPGSEEPAAGVEARASRWSGAARQASGRLDASARRDLPWIRQLREAGEIVVPDEDLGEALTTLLEMPSIPRLETPGGLPLLEEGTEPHPHLVLEPDRSPAWTNPPLRAELRFAYGDLEVDAGDPRAAIVDVQQGSFVRRDLDGERDALVRLLELPLRPVPAGKGHGLELDPQAAAGGRRAAARRRVVGRGPRPLAAAAEPAGAAHRERHRLVRGQGGDRVCRRADRDEGAARRRSPAAIASCSSRTARRGCCRPPGWRPTTRWRSSRRARPTTGCASCRRRRCWSMRCSRPAAPPSVDEAVRRAAAEAALVRADQGQEGAARLPTARCATTSATAWAGSASCASSASAACSPTTWASARPCRCSRCCAPTAPPARPPAALAGRGAAQPGLQLARRVRPFHPRSEVTEYHGTDREELHGTLGDYDLVVTTYGTLRRDIGFLPASSSTPSILDEAQAIKNPRVADRQGEPAAGRAGTGSRSPARRSRTTSASSGRCSSS